MFHGLRRTRVRRHGRREGAPSPNVNRFLTTVVMKATSIGNCLWTLVEYDEIATIVNADAKCFWARDPKSGNPLGSRFMRSEREHTPVPCRGSERPLSAILARDRDRCAKAEASSSASLQQDPRGRDILRHDVGDDHDHSACDGDAKAHLGLAYPAAAACLVDNVPMGHRTGDRQTDEDPECRRNGGQPDRERPEPVRRRGPESSGCRPRLWPTRLHSTAVGLNVCYVICCGPGWEKRARSQKVISFRSKRGGPPLCTK